jgi:tetratricopeptide (TPR) repeat protein
MPFRRRFPPRRFPRRPFRRPGARQAIQALRRAHQLLENGEFREAAEIFERLADSATQRGFQQAPNLNFQAARAWLQAGQIDKALPRTRSGLELLLDSGRYQRFAAAEKRILEMLESQGYKAEADQLRAELERMKAGKPIPEIAFPTSKVKLPSKCPYCGGSILPDEVEWFDEVTPGCSYCGSPLQS